MSRNPGKTGIVYLVGAGPGHPGLITRMGYELLQSCDAVAYDALIPPELIASLPDRVERYYVGRRAGRHSMPQGEKNSLLVKLAQRGLKVVRLKGGDTAFFGGSAEEAECLAAAGIPVVVVPGVTAASAVAAVSGLPFTDRRHASWVLFATGHGSENTEVPVPWQEIAALRGGTIVVYMGLANLDLVVSQLIAGGYAGHMPCMVVQGATTGVEKIVISKLLDVAADCRREQLKPPAMAIVGPVVQNRTPPLKPLAPLAGKRVLIPCCAQETEAVSAALRERGAEPLSYPAYRLERFNDAAGWARFLKLAASGGWCLFASETEVRFFSDALLRHKLDLRALGRFRIAACGRNTEAALLQAHIRADKALLPKPGKPVPVNNSCRHNLVVFSEVMPVDTKKWKAVLRLKLFRTKPASWESHWIQEVRDNPPDFILFRNAAEVDGLVAVLGQEAARDLSGKCTIVVADNSAKAAARRYGLRLTTGSTMLGIVSLAQ